MMPKFLFSHAEIHKVSIVLWLCFALVALTGCKHIAVNRPLISFRAIAEIYKEVGELFELSVVVSENVFQPEDERPEIYLKVVSPDAQQLYQGAKETNGSVVKFKDMHLNAPCLDNCRLQAELVMPHTTMDETSRRRTTIAIPLRIVAASWALHVNREGNLGFKIKVTHYNQPVVHTEAKVAVCNPPCLPWGGNTKDNSLFTTQSIKLNDTGTWRGKLNNNGLTQNFSKKPWVYVKIAGRILRQELPAMGL